MLLFRPCALHLALAVSFLVGLEPATLRLKPLPRVCFNSTADQFCKQEFDDALQECLETAELSDFVVKGNKICYSEFLQTCISSDLCPEIKMSRKIPVEPKGSLDPPSTDNGPESDVSSTFQTQMFFNLTSPFGQAIFWTQLGFGIFFLIGFAITIGIVIWCRKKMERLTEELPQQDQILKETPGNLEASSNRHPTPPPHQTDLNAAWDDARSSVYDNPEENSTGNPFIGWDMSNSELDIPPPPQEWFPLVTKCDKATMTHYKPDCETLNAMSTLERNAIRSKGARPKEVLSKAQLVQIHNALHSHLEMAGHYMAPSRALPPKPPSRTSSLRWSKAKAKMYLGSADPMPKEFSEY